MWGLHCPLRVNIPTRMYKHETLQLGQQAPQHSSFIETQQFPTWAKKKHSTN